MQKQHYREKYQATILLFHRDFKCTGHSGKPAFSDLQFGILVFKDPGFPKATVSDSCSFLFATSYST